MILCRDDWIVAVHKPSGLPVHPSAWARTKDTLLARTRDRVGHWVYPAHRLDGGTSGVMVFGATPEAGRRLALAFQERRVRKVYRAVVRGWTEAEGVIDHALAEEKGKALLEARSEYRSLARTELPHAVGRYLTARYSLIEVTPWTGRQHQIRRHCCHISHPIAGDTTHGDGAHNRFFRSEFGCRRLLLWATELTFPHPADGRRMTVRATTPPDVEHVLHAAGLTAPQSAR